MPPCRQGTPGLQARQPFEGAIGLIAVPLSRFLQRLYDLSIGIGAQYGVHLGNFADNLLPVTLRQAACHNQCPAAARLLVFRHIQDCLDALFLGVVDEAAAIDNNRLGLSLFIGKGMPRLAQCSNHIFRIYQVLVTAQGNE